MSSSEQDQTAEEKFYGYVQNTLGAIALAVSAALTLHGPATEVQEHVSNNLTPSQVCITGSAMAPRGCD